MTLLLYAVIATALWYLGSRAVITRALWSRYPTRFASFMDCPACVGFWWGLILALVAGVHPEHLPRTELHPILVGLVMIVLVAIFAGIMQRALWEAGSATSNDVSDDANT